MKYTTDMARDVTGLRRLIQEADYLTENRELRIEVRTAALEVSIALRKLLLATEL